MNVSVSLAARAMLAALTVAALGSTSACTVESEAEDVEDGVAAALTVENGDAYVDSVSDDVVVLRKSVGGKPLKLTVGDFANKSILVHPIPGKTEAGVYAHVESSADEGDRLALHVRPLAFEEMETTRGQDVIRIYRDASLPVVKEGVAPASGTPLLAPASDTGGIQPLGVSGPLSGDIHDEIWVGREQRTGTFRLKVETASLRFDPRATVEYTKGRGLAVGVKGEFAADLAIRMTGPLSTRATIFKSPVLKSPRTKFVVPMGVPPAVVPVPILIGVDTYLECSALGELDTNSVFESHVKVTTSASTRLHPSLRRPLAEWVEAGPWPSTVSATASVTARDGSVMTGAGVSCALPRIDFPITVGGILGPFLGIEPAAAMTTRGAQRSVDVYAGAASELLDDRPFAIRLARWTP